MKYTHVAALVYERPWAIMPRALEAIVEVLELRLEHGRLSEEEIRDRLAVAQTAAAGPRSGGRRAGTVAVIPIYGVLAHRASLFAETSTGGSSVEAIRAAFREAMSDPDVSAIAFDIDSPGGSVDGIPELASEIRDARGTKPISAVINTLGASAAYWIASQADEIVATPSSITGSIGVYARHQDVSALADKMGVKTTLISAGKYKVEGNEFEPLGDDARAHIQSIVDETYGMFVDAVAKGRGVTSAAVRNGYGQGRVLTANKAKTEGLVDRVGTFDEAIRRVGTGKVAMRHASVEGWASERTADGFTGRLVGIEVPPDGTMSAAIGESVDDLELERERAEADSRRRRLASSRQ